MSTPGSAQDYSPSALGAAAAVAEGAQVQPGTSSSSRDPGASPNGTATRRSERYQPDQIDGDTSTDADESDYRGDESGAERDKRGRSETGRDRRTTPPSEFETYVSEVADKPLRRFGANLLVPSARDFTAPPTTTVPPDYRLNPGDELVIGLTGSVQAVNLRLVIDSEGRVFVPRVGAVVVGGVRYGDVQAVLARQLSRQYRNFQSSVAIGRLHGITVYVTGFAATPGSYTLSSLSTLVNAVLAAGGPSAGGSFRSIQVRRSGRLIADFDLYDLLLKGDKSADIALQNGDVVFIAPVGAQVGVIGSVNNEAVFETRPNDTLEGVVGYAGGANTVADISRLLVLGAREGGASGWDEITPADSATRIARRGEIVRVLSTVGIIGPLEKQSVLVTVIGEVANPGRYQLPPGVTLAEALQRSGGLTGGAYPYATVFARESVQRLQRISYDRAIRDLEFLLTAQPLVSNAGNDKIQMSQLDAVRAVVAQLEARRPTGRVVLDIAESATGLPGNIVLENNDSVYVPPRPVTVGVFGSVPGPGSFRFTSNTTIASFIGNAGGVLKIGDKSSVFVVRANGQLLAPRRGAFSGSILRQRALPGDLIFVPIDANRGALWAKLRDGIAAIFQVGLSAATVVAVSK